ncbi:hypothetical protein A3H10_02205 [Candidatus Uhrbacteria bacterium RIFCSPLOWO2_12_FULL_46_10]|uniref:Cob(I)yrinic acid a,c-diamide adenosyltransferase n=1 Tax=Candidatus Uhrbacteria bacterium RIFCSPLOWO2_01_FULL_47_25 TaxID=1802402 RepID=A0A1F7UW79_9BACT|nr:MAG: Cob(I)alamin adenosyltransferase [Parcubacteria group bacterium GW2011_GWA2_46_9]OGL59680.1 MAG: hypothetical protein A2752_05055 [Candidatus Uhrbacteria bacterium RIFCSPHIGHO2_01_FULL_46_23]OGL68029.1 MAG: hypothetical protein A3D60_02745 [Candidatus Uhrbacteria bacterium RIFCSPHIGHO2_02_FULL_47_29]OGL76206.1 MAG: hypothetical protein A3E96_03790 [Candidatus Uhrbacteria bacterium RIFCSPHIGHO2_12_FULL_46_13]OGL82529.1 MAG: hypothetical protein A2936_03865 [Candidatus Uhrbacteria bacteri
MVSKKKSIAKKGLFIIYVGRGKGKTTAAMGLAIRAAGMGLNVYIIQFIKGEWPSGERNFIEAFNIMRQRYKNNKKIKIGRLKILASGRGFVKILGDKKPIGAHKKAARQALELSQQAMLSHKYDVVILDEAISAIETKLIKINDLLKFVRLKPDMVHLVMTGHDAPKSLITKADLVSDVKMVKHPYYQGVLAQRGIDY